MVFCNVILLFYVLGRKMIEEGEEKKKKENTGTVNPFSNNWRNKESHNTVRNKAYLNSLIKLSMNNIGASKIFSFSILLTVKL